MTRRRAYRISGSVIGKKNRVGVADIQIEAWDKDLLVDDFVGSTQTDKNGRFQIQFNAAHFAELFLDRRPDLFFRVYSGDRLIHSTEDSVLWNVESDAVDIEIEIDESLIIRRPQMAVKEYWIQIENRPWDASPNNIDRMHGNTIEENTGVKPVDVTITSPETGVVRTVKMYLPTNEGVVTNAMGEDEWDVSDALILRRYTANWAMPDDRKVNPWDLNENDPTDNGTMGTIPGPTIECNVGDKVIVHFRNKDFRVGKSFKQRAHSLHPHGIVFAPEYDGAYPLSPPDTTQPIPPGEAAAWSGLGVSGFKQGDRVPPDGTFTYTWDTFGWPATAGVWHYHDHSICDAENVEAGALGFLVIHNPADPDDVVNQDLPNGQHNGALTRLRCIPFEFPFQVLPQDRAGFRLIERKKDDLSLSEPLSSGQALAKMHAVLASAAESQVEGDEEELVEKPLHEGPHEPTLALVRDNLVLEVSPIDWLIRRFCFRVYVDPPQQAQYLQYYHELPGVGMTINGRRYLGNTPTVIGGVNTKMRFGLAAMNNLTFHTFHLHGHRWTIPGPDGNNPGAIQTSPQVVAVSQFEDTRIFGPANSFAFTINQGSFMGSRFTPDPSRAPGLGEWHMHCHVLSHMMPGGMMGSLLVINGGEFFLKLPSGDECHDEMDEMPADTVVVDGFAFTPSVLPVTSGTMVTFDFKEADHTVTTVSVTGAASGIELNNGGGPIDAVPAGTLKTAVVTGNSGDVISYRCGIHGAGMSGTIQIV